MLRLIYVILILFILSNIGAAAMASKLLWEYRQNKLIMYVSIVMAAIGVDSFCSLMATVVRIQAPVGTAYAVWILCGRFIKTMACWAFVLFLIGRHTGGE